MMEYFIFMAFFIFLWRFLILNKLWLNMFENSRILFATDWLSVKIGILKNLTIARIKHFIYHFNTYSCVNCSIGFEFPCSNTRFYRYQLRFQIQTL